MQSQLTGFRDHTGTHAMTRSPSKVALKQLPEVKSGTSVHQVPYVPLQNLKQQSKPK